VTAGRLRLGVLALQGDFDAHRRVLAGLGVEAVEVRRAATLRELDGLVLPGGESTALLHLLGDDFPPALRAFHARGRPLFGTCAGAILLAREVVEPRQPSLSLIDLTVARNAYGRQRESFEAELEAAVAEPPVRLAAPFIRAPRIRRAGPGVVVLARHDGEPVLVREGPVLVSTFHPELTPDPAVHRYFVGLAAGAR
jgi:5'-phosphate synthase pdxT subunit